MDDIDYKFLSDSMKSIRDIRKSVMAITSTESNLLKKICKLEVKFDSKLKHIGCSFGTSYNDVFGKFRHHHWILNIIINKLLKISKCIGIILAIIGFIDMFLYRISEGSYHFIEKIVYFLFL